MKPVLAKALVKLAVGAVGSAVIGYTIKMEKAAEAKMDEHYSKKKDEDEEPQP